MKNFISLFFGVILVTQLCNSEDVNLRQLFHQQHPTRLPVSAIFNRIRERLTSRPTHIHHLITTPNYWQLIHQNLHQIQTLNTIGNNPITLPPLLTSINTNTPFTISTLPTITTLQPNVNSVTVTVPTFTTTSSTTVTATTSTTLSPAKQSENVTPPFFLTATNKPTTVSSSLTDSTTLSTIIDSSSQSQTSALITQSQSLSTNSMTQSPITDSTLTQSQSTTSSISLTDSTKQSSIQTNPSTQSQTSDSTILSQTTEPITQLSTSLPVIDSTILSSTQQTSSSSTTSTTSSIPTTTTKDLCANRTALYANGTTLVKLCYIADSLNWQAARARCMSMGYRIFEPNTMNEELALFKYIKSFASNNQFFWMNAKAEIVASIADWYSYDPYQVWDYTTTSWYRLVDAPVPETCLGVIYINSAPKFTSKSCDSFQATLWCEYN